MVNAIALPIDRGAQAAHLLGDDCRPRFPSIARPARRRPRGPVRCGFGPRHSTVVRPPFAWRCRRDRCPAATGCRSRACADSESSASMMVSWKAWPMCRVPVTFGGGMTMENAGPVPLGAKYPRRPPSARRCALRCRRARRLYPFFDRPRAQTSAVSSIWCVSSGTLRSRYALKRSRPRRRRSSSASITSAMRAIALEIAAAGAAPN